MLAKLSVYVFPIFGGPLAMYRCNIYIASEINVKIWCKSWYFVDNYFMKICLYKHVDNISVK